MNPLEHLKALEAIRDKAAHACADITASLPPNDLRDYLTKAHYGAFATKFTAPFVIHTIATLPAKPPTPTWMPRPAPRRGSRCNHECP